MMQIVAENEGCEQEVKAEYSLQPRGHRARAHILIRRPRDPEECNRQPCAEHIVEIPEHTLKCRVMCEREDLHHAVDLPQEQHRREEEDGAACPLMQHTAAYARAPDDGDRQHQREQGKPLVRLCGREGGTLQNLPVIAAVRRAQRAQEIGRQRGGGGRQERRIACRREIAGQRLGESDRRARENALGHGERPVCGHDHPEARAAPNETIRLVGKEHIHIAFARTP